MVLQARSPSNLPKKGIDLHCPFLWCNFALCFLCNKSHGYRQFQCPAPGRAVIKLEWLLAHDTTHIKKTFQPFHHSAAIETINSSQCHDDPAGRGFAEKLGKFDFRR